MIKHLIGALALTITVAACGSPSGGDPRAERFCAGPQPNEKLTYYCERLRKDYKSVASRTPNDVWNEHMQAEIAGNQAAGDCPKVGEIAAPRSGQVAATMAQNFGGVENIYPKPGGPAYHFVQTSSDKRVRKADWIGQNAFGATRRVESYVVSHNGVAVTSGELSDRVLRKANWASALASNIVSKTRMIDFNDRQTLWISGSAVGGPIEADRWTEATISSPVEATRLYKASMVLDLKCAAVIDTKTGEVLERMY
jgi:hypothetical protein